MPIIEAGLTKRLRRDLDAKMEHCLLTATASKDLETMFNTETHFHLGEDQRFVVYPTMFGEQKLYGLVYQVKVRGLMLNQGTEYFSASNPRSVLTAIYLRQKHGHPGQPTHYTEVLPGRNETMLPRCDTDIIAKRMVMAMRATGSLFLYGNLSFLHEKLAAHHRYHHIFNNSHIQSLSHACLLRSQGNRATGLEQMTDDELLMHYRDALVTFIVDAGIEMSTEFGRVGIERNEANYLLDANGRNYPATVNHYTINFLSWEDHGFGAVEYGWMSNNPEYQDGNQPIEAASMFIARHLSADPTQVTGQGETLENIHKEELKRRSATEWELQTN